MQLASRSARSSPVEGCQQRQHVLAWVRGPLGERVVKIVQKVGDDTVPAFHVGVVTLPGDRPTEGVHCLGQPAVTLGRHAKDVGDHRER